MTLEHEELKALVTGWSWGRMVGKTLETKRKELSPRMRRSLTRAHDAVHERSLL